MLLYRKTLRMENSRYQRKNAFKLFLNVIIIYIGFPFNIFLFYFFRFVLHHTSHRKKNTEFEIHFYDFFIDTTPIRQKILKKLFFVFVSLILQKPRTFIIHFLFPFWNLQKNSLNRSFCFLLNIFLVKRNNRIFMKLHPSLYLIRFFYNFIHARYA